MSLIESINNTPSGWSQAFMVGLGVPAIAVCGVLAATGHGRDPIKLPENTERIAWPVKGERAFIPPAGLERFVSCGDTHNNLNTQSYSRREILDGGRIAIVCGSKDNLLPNSFPQVTITLQNQEQ